MVEVSAALAVAAMALATYVTRMSGLVIMSFVRITPRVRRGLEALSGSVLVAIVVPAAVRGDLASQVAVAASAGVMLATRNAVFAMVAGIVAAAGIRAFAGAG